MVPFFLYFSLGFISKSVDFISLGVLSRMIISSYLTVSSGIKKGILTKKEIKDFKVLMLLMFILFNLAWFSYQFAIRFDLVSIVSPISSLNPALTVVLAVLILKEKLVMNQKMGIIAVLSGLVMLSLL